MATTLILSTSEQGAESARPVLDTARQLLISAIALSNNEAQLHELALRNRVTGLTEAIAERQRLRAVTATMTQQLETRPAALDALDLALTRVKVACLAEGARLTIAALPLDVMVSNEEWAKYGGPQVDLTQADVLAHSVVKRAHRLGAVGVDLTPALRAAEPGAFLMADLHLTPKGHEAVAQALAQALQRQPPMPDTLVLPPGRSWPPLHDEWAQAPEVIVKGSSTARCETKRLSEWFHMTCRSFDSSAPVWDMQVRKGGHGDAALRFNRTSSIELLMPFIEGDSATIDVTWLPTAEESARWPSGEQRLRERTLTLDWPDGGSPTMAFGPNRSAAEVSSRQSRPDQRIEMFLGPCPEGLVHGGAWQRCAAPCTTDEACGLDAHCEPWPSGGFCATP